MIGYVPSEIGGLTYHEQHDWCGTAEIKPNSREHQSCCLCLFVKPDTGVNRQATAVISEAE